MGIGGAARARASDSPADIPETVVAPPGGGVGGVLEFESSSSLDTSGSNSSIRRICARSASTSLRTSARFVSPRLAAPSTSSVAVKRVLSSMRASRAATSVLRRRARLSVREFNRFAASRGLRQTETMSFQGSHRELACACSPAMPSEECECTGKFR